MGERTILRGATTAGSGMAAFVAGSHDGTAGGNPPIRASSLPSWSSDQIELALGFAIDEGRSMRARFHTPACQFGKHRRVRAACAREVTWSRFVSPSVGAGET